MKCQVLFFVRGIASIYLHCSAAYDQGLHCLRQIQEFYKTGS